MSDASEILVALESRFGPDFVRRRLGMEKDHEARLSGGHHDKWYSHPTLIRTCLKLVGMHGRAQHNASHIEVRHNDVSLVRLNAAFDRYTVLHLSDLHVDINDTIVTHIASAIYDLEYDLCVLTGDYRAASAGPIEATLDGMRRIRAVLRGPVVGVLGNHDSLRMVPALEEMGVRMLLNESVSIERGGVALQFVGVDDPHYYHADDLDRASMLLDKSGVASILLSHTPEVYSQAAHAGFDLMLCGHTHGGQICLPGGVPITLDAPRLPRRYGRGAWRHLTMQGYTSVGAGTSIVDARLNCPPEVTLHHLRCG